MLLMLDPVFCMLRKEGKPGEGSVDLVIRLGEEHAFGGNLKLDEDKWLRKSLEKATELRRPSCAEDEG